MDKKKNQKKRKIKSRMIGRVLALLLAVGMLAGCSGGTEEKAGTASPGSAAAAASAAKGRFMESEVVLPEEVTEIYCMRRLSDGDVMALGANKDNGKGYLFRTEDMGESWTVQETAPVFYTWIMGTAIAPDGTVFACGDFENAGEETEYSMKKIAADGSITDIPLVLPESTNDLLDENYVRQMGADETGRLLVLDSNNDILEVDPDTGECTELAAENDEYVIYFGISGEKLFLVTYSGILVYSTADGTRLPQDAVLNEMFKSEVSTAEKSSDRAFPAVFAAGTEEEGIVYANQNGIYFHWEDATVDEQLVNGELNSLGDPSISLYAIVMADDENFLVALGDASGDKILRYSYDENASALPETELTVYALWDSDLLRQAISLYQKENQNVYVSLEIGMTGEDGITVEDAVTALNAKILAGTGPDVLILDGLPAESYIEKGVLADISDIVEEIEQTDGLFSNIKNVYDKDGAFYEIPARFYPVIVFGTPEIVEAGNSLEAFADCVEQLGEQNESTETKILQRRTAEELLRMLYQADSAGWQKADGSLDEEKLSEWLYSAKRIYDADAKRASVSEDVYYGGMDISGTVLSGVSGIMLENNLAGLGTISSVGQLGNMLSMRDELGAEYTYGILNVQETASFTPYLMAGINGASDAPKEASAFLRILLGKECGSADGGGFSINRAGYLAACEAGIEKYGEGGLWMGFSSADGEGIISYQCFGLKQEEADKFTELLESLTMPALTDNTIEEVIIAQGEDYLEGGAELEETLASIRQKLDLYLAEK